MDHVLFLDLTPAIPQIRQDERSYIIYGTVKVQIVMLQATFYKSS